MRVQAWAPGHATLMFSVPHNYEDPQVMGSIGVGFNFDTGVLTTIEKSTKDRVNWNSKPINGEVSLTALNQFRQRFDITEKFEINHYSELKIGYGLSTSGAGSLGVVLGMNEYMNTDANKDLLYSIAHYADVVNHTGLGSVMGQITGGIEIRLTQGGPTVGKTKQIRSNEEVIILMIDKLKTSDVLVSETQMRQVTEAGQNAIEKIKKLENRYVDSILEIGREFTAACGLATPKVNNLLNKLAAIGENNASMAMIGETIIIHPNNSTKVVNFARKYDIDCIVTNISNTLPMIIENTSN